MNKKVILMILDGWGKSPNPKVSAVDNANTPFIDSLYKNYANANLLTDGMNVGLPDGQMGNSEVGHMNLGAGRIVYQDLAKINKAVRENTLRDEKELKDAFEYANKNHKDVHFLGLLSDGGVHSHTDHIKGLIKAGKESGVQNMYVHAFTDGRDVDPKSGKGFLKDLVSFSKDKNTKLATVIGRYYAMDRDKRWERVKEAYDVIVNAEGEKTTDISKAIQNSYDNDITDEFIKPIVMTDADGNPVAQVKENDVVIFFNFRTDRGRELTQVLSQEDMHEQNMHKLKLYYVTMTNYDESYNNVHVVYNKDNIVETLGEVLAKAGKKQIRIAETEKYPHVTFFFNGGYREPLDKSMEDYILIPSDKGVTFADAPAMKAKEIADKAVELIAAGKHGFGLINFANADMVGHCGHLEPAIAAIEVVDAAVGRIVDALQAVGGCALITADHGNAEEMRVSNGHGDEPSTRHSLNPVPCILFDAEFDGSYTLRQPVDGNVYTTPGLSHIAATMLNMLGHIAPGELQPSLIEPKGDI